MVFDCRNVWKMIFSSIHHIFRATKNKGWHRLPPSQTWDVGLFIYWLFLQGYSAYFYSEWITGFEWERLQSSGKPNTVSCYLQDFSLRVVRSNKRRWCCRAYAGRASRSRWHPGFLDYREAMWVTLKGLCYSDMTSAADKSDWESWGTFHPHQRKIYLCERSSFHSPRSHIPMVLCEIPSCPSRFLIFDIRAVTPRRPFLKPQWWRLC